MLGNKYFLSRQYFDAIKVFEKVLEEEPHGKSLKKKLIICYTHTGKFNEALNLFYELIKKDIDFVINTYPREDDCPCPELIEKYGKILPYENNSIDLLKMLGILWLYCDPKKSLGFFKTLQSEIPEDNRIKEIVSIIEHRLSGGESIQKTLTIRE